MQYSNSNLRPVWYLCMREFVVCVRSSVYLIGESINEPLLDRACHPCSFLV